MSRTAMGMETEQVEVYSHLSVRLTRSTRRTIRHLQRTASVMVGARDCSGIVTSLGYNLVESSAECDIRGDTTGNLTDVQANIGPLADNGAPTQTHRLNFPSPAINDGERYVLYPEWRGRRCSMDRAR